MLKPALRPLHRYDTIGQLRSPYFIRPAIYCRARFVAHWLSRIATAKWRGSETKKFLEKHEDAFRWLMFLIGLGLVARFLLENVVGWWPCV
jgi:hypothetical protein